MMIDWGIETYVNEASTNDVLHVGSMISNRFSQTHSVDDHSYTTMTTEGTAIFRTDAIYKDGISPDFFRSKVFSPIPQGFRREILYVKGREDVTGILYGYKDTQVPVNFVAGPFIKGSSISVVHRQAVTTRADLLGGALSAYDRILGARANKHIADPNRGVRPPTEIGYEPGMEPPNTPVPYKPPNPPRPGGMTGSAGT
jgi:hypothetical protein